MGANVITTADIDRAKRLRSLGWNLRRIAKELGRSRSGIERVLADPYSDGRFCDDCSAPVSNINLTGLCRSCQRVSILFRG